jgi:hypothetical protein
MGLTIRTPNHLEGGSEALRASTFVPANSPAGGGSQRMQTLLEIGAPGPVMAGPAVANGSTHQYSITVASAPERELTSFGSMFASLANISEEPRNLLSPLIDSEPLFGLAGSDADEGYKGSAASNRAVTGKRDRPRGIVSNLSLAHAPDILETSASTGKVPVTEKFGDVEREERHRQLSASDSRNGRTRAVQRQRSGRGQDMPALTPFQLDCLAPGHRPEQQPSATILKFKPPPLPPAPCGPPSILYYNDPAEYYKSFHLLQKQCGVHYWNTRLTDNGLMLDGMERLEDTIRRVPFPSLIVPWLPVHSTKLNLLKTLNYLTVLS